MQSRKDKVIGSKTDLINFSIANRDVKIEEL